MIFFSLATVSFVDSVLYSIESNKFEIEVKKHVKYWENMLNSLHKEVEYGTFISIYFSWCFFRLLL